MSRLTFDDLTPDDMPAPFIDDAGDRADAYRDSHVDCGAPTMMPKPDELQRAKLATQRAAETDPLLREAIALAARAGFDWYNTESSARRMANHAAAEVLALRTALQNTLNIFRDSMGTEAWREWIGTSQHGPSVRNDEIVAALALLPKVPT